MKDNDFLDYSLLSYGSGNENFSLIREETIMGYPGRGNTPVLFNVTYKVAKTNTRVIVSLRDKNSPFYDSTGNLVKEVSFTSAALFEASAEAMDFMNHYFDQLEENISNS